MPDQVTYELRGYRAYHTAGDYGTKKVYNPEETVHGDTPEEAINALKEKDNRFIKYTFGISCYLLVWAALATLKFEFGGLGCIPVLAVLLASVFRIYTNKGA